MFTTLPSNYDSLYKEAIFAFTGSSEGDSAPDRVVDIVDSLSGETIAVKKFYSSDNYQVNVSPIVKPLTYPDIAAEGSGFIQDSDFEVGAKWVHLVDDDGNQSSSVLLSQSKHGEPEKGVVSSMPASQDRVISLGEREFIRLYDDPSQQICVTISQCNASGDVLVQHNYTADVNEYGFVTFCLLAEDLTDQSVGVGSINLEISNTNKYYPSINYLVIDAPYNPTRLAWVSSYSTIEHYTFPNVVERWVDSDGVQHLKLESAPESDAMREAIAEAVVSPRLWVATEGGYCEANMVSESVDLTARARLASVQFEVEYCDE